MKDGNSGFKLQLAMGPNQLIQDEMVKNCAIGLRDVIYITTQQCVPCGLWRALWRNLCTSCSLCSAGIFRTFCKAIHNILFPPLWPPLLSVMT
jgi:hypothetical protein